VKTPLLLAFALIAAATSLYCVPASEPMNLDEEPSRLETQSNQEMTAQRAGSREASDQSDPVSSGSKIRIRGNNSIVQGEQPIIYVDGVRFENGQMAIDMINPDDIDRIEVLKGPEALKLYGTEGANGVIQIFTKGGGA